MTNPALNRYRALKQSAAQIREAAQYTDSSQARTAQLDNARRIDVEAADALDAARFRAMALPAEYVRSLDQLLGKED